MNKIKYFVVFYLHRCKILHWNTTLVRILLMETLAANFRLGCGLHNLLELDIIEKLQT